MRFREFDLKCRDFLCLCLVNVHIRNYHGHQITMVRLKSYAWKRETHKHIHNRQKAKGGKGGRGD